MSRLRQILASYTVRHSIIATISVTAASGLGAIFYMLVAKIMGPAEYGLFSLTMSVLLLGLSVADLGVTQGLVKFVAADRETHGYFPYLRLSFVVKLVSGTVFFLGTVVLAQVLGEHVFHKPEIAPLLPIVGIGVFTQLLFALSLSVFQGLQKFILWGGLQIGVNLIRIILLGPFILVGSLNSRAGLIVFALAYLVGFVVSAKWLPTKWWRSHPTTSQTRSFWNFNKWTLGVSILSSILGRVDILIAGRYLSLTEVGTYSLATIMVVFLPQLSSALGAVTTAKFASIKEKSHERDYLKKSSWFVSAIGVAVALAMIPIALGVIWFTGADYAPAFAPFLILLVAQIVFMCANPLRDSIMYFHSDPKIFIWLNIAHVATVAVTGLALVGSWGAIGLAVAVLVGQIVSGVGSLIYYRYLNAKS